MVQTRAQKRGAEEPVSRRTRSKWPKLESEPVKEKEKKKKTAAAAPEPEPEPEPTQPIAALAEEQPALYDEPAGPMTYGTYVLHMLRWAGIRDRIRRERGARDPPIYANDAVYDPATRDARHGLPFEFNPNMVTYQPSDDLIKERYRSAAAEDAVLRANAFVDPEGEVEGNGDSALLAYYRENDYDPAAFDPDVYDPAAFDPDVYDSTSYDPDVYDPAAFDPDVYDPTAYDPDVPLHHTKSIMATVYYLAYSIDMSPSHMSLLSPSVTPVGLGHLRGFKWFISSSGRPSITRASQHSVYGIVYSIPYDLITERIASMGKLGFVIGRVDVSLGCEAANMWVGEHFALYDVDKDGKAVKKMKETVRACAWVAVAPSEGEVTDRELLRDLNRGIVFAKVHGMPDRWAEEVLRSQVGYPKEPLEL